MILVAVRRKEEKGKAKDQILAHYHQVLFPGFGEENPQTF
jgi:hypothetical protein